MKIQVTHVKFEGDNESIREVLRSLPQLFGGHVAEQPALAELEPLEPLPALPAPTISAPAEIQNPVVARKLTQRRTRTPAPAAEPAAAPAPATKPAATDKPSRAPAGERANTVLLICREKAGQFTLDEAAKLAGVKKQQVHNGLWYAKNKGNEWACVGEFQFKRAVLKHDTPAIKADAADDEVMAFNPNITGGNRRQPSEQPTPAHIAAE